MIIVFNYYYHYKNGLLYDDDPIPKQQLSRYWSFGTGVERRAAYL